jgi:tetratricopeptide (TPR) repeat protein
VIESSVIGLEIIFEHRNYLPSMMAVLLALVLIFPVLRHPSLKVVFLCIVMLLFSFWTFERNKVWSDTITLWGDCVIKSPGKARPHNNLGVALKKQDRINEAAEHFKKTIDIDPQFTEAYNNLGNAYNNLGKYKEAITQYEMAVKSSPHSPETHVNLGNALAKRWQLEEALLHYGEALRLKPNYDEARLNYISTQRMIESRKLRNKQPEQ